MATFDFTPLYHSTVGFDRLSNLLSHALDRDESGYLWDLLPDWGQRRLGSALTTRRRQDRSTSSALTGLSLLSGCVKTLSDL